MFDLYVLTVDSPDSTTLLMDDSELGNHPCCHMKMANALIDGAYLTRNTQWSCALSHVSQIDGIAFYDMTVQKTQSSHMAWLADGRCLFEHSGGGLIHAQLLRGPEQNVQRSGPVVDGDTSASKDEIHVCAGQFAWCEVDQAMRNWDSRRLQLASDQALGLISTRRLTHPDEITQLTLYDIEFEQRHFVPLAVLECVAHAREQQVRRDDQRCAWGNDLQGGLM